MSTSKTYQQSLADAGSETRPPMLERGSYIPWASRFRRYINRKRENQKWLNKALDEGPYKFEMFIPNNSTLPKLQTAEDLQGDALLHYDAEMELMNLILLFIINDIYNSADACTSAKDMWKRVERLMKGTIQNKVDRETRFTNEFDQFIVEPGEALVSVYNRFAQLMNNLKRNDMHFPIVTINTKFLNSLQLEWLKYVTQVRLAKRLTVDTFDDLFDYLQQFEKLVNVSRAKKLEKSDDPLALVAHTGSSSRNTSSYYVTHPTSVVDYEDEYQQDDVHTNSEDPLTSAMLLLARAITQIFSTLTNNRLRTSSNTKNQVIIQGDRVNIQSRNSGNAERNNRRAYVYEEIGEGSNAPNETKNVQRTLRTSSSGNTSTVQCYNCNEAGVILTDEQNDFLFADASRMEEIKELSANICLNGQISTSDKHYLMLAKAGFCIYNLGNSEFSFDVRDTEDTLDDASKSQQKVYEKMNDLIAVANKQNCWTIDYAQINALYKDFVPQKELSAEQKYFTLLFLLTRIQMQLLLSRHQCRVVQIVLWIVDSGCSKHMTGDRSLLKNFIEKFMGTVCFGNDNFAPITGYGDYIQGNITICHVYYVEGLGHNLFSVGQFCDGNLEVAFRSETCYVHNLEGDDLLTGDRESNLYTISISDMAAFSPVCLMSKATSTI
ncbi:hypothetical protein Tco_0941243 [Tanacetum coccineum]|uniref:Retrovirus-related Pol polyprotein from transposon TNT 1-94-like beta-barrel domain-containing protein n=1 Tax=Tanacetum coccineum TaxID=301880 RepID=A0ABQ5DR63_9ASTR